METIICPVCGKPGIPDYHKEDVVCPQCKCDLSIYRVIESIPDAKSGRNIWKPISVTAFTAAAVCGFMLFHNSKTNNQADSGSINQEITLLKDSVRIIKTELQEMKSNSVLFPYVVRKGDSYWSISKKMYGTGLRAEELARNNNRTLEMPLFVGDTINIK